MIYCLPITTTHATPPCQSIKLSQVRILPQATVHTHTHTHTNTFPREPHLIGTPNGIVVKPSIKYPILSQPPSQTIRSLPRRSRRMQHKEERHDHIYLPVVETKLIFHSRTVLELSHQKGIGGSVMMRGALKKQRKM